MAVKNRKPSRASAKTPEPRSRRPRAEEEERIWPRDDEGLGPSEIPEIIDTRSPHEPDPREVESITDRIFASVLSRYGWERHEGRIEHVGEEARPRR